MPIGEQIKTLRKQCGWSEADLSDRIACDPGQVSRYENGRITPSVEGIPRRPYRRAGDALNGAVG